MEEQIHDSVDDQTVQRTRKPPLYAVLLLNDDYTTMDFVIHILQAVFRKSLVEATQIMLHVHKRGVGVAGVYPRDIAETKIEEVHTSARSQGFPLKCRMEKE